MADHMTAEQLADWLETIACQLDDAQSAEARNCGVEYTDGNLERAAALRDIAARLSGMAADWTHVDSAEPSHNKRNESFGTEYFVHPSQPGERTAFYGRRLGGKAKWYRHGAPVTGVTHYMPLPAAPEPPHV